MAIDYDQMVTDAYEGIGRTGIGTKTNQIDPEGFDFWTDQLSSGAIAPDQFYNQFNAAVGNYFTEKPDDRYTSYVTDYLVKDAYGDLGRTGIGDQPNQIDQQGYDYWINQLQGGMTPDQFNQNFDAAAQNALNVPSAQSQTPQATKDYVINYLRQNPGSGINVNPQSGGPYLGAPVSYGGNNYQQMDTSGEYADPLIQALRKQSNERFSNNPGVFRMATTQPSSGALQPLDPNRKPSIFTPERLSLDAYDPAKDPRRIQITDLYRQVLKRDPDEPGINSFANSDMTLDQIRQAMFDSPEYAQQNPAGIFQRVANMAAYSDA